MVGPAVAVAFRAISGDADDWPGPVRIASRHEPLLQRTIRQVFAESLARIDGPALAAAGEDPDRIVAALKVDEADARLVAASRTRLQGAFMDGADYGIGELADRGVPASLKRQGAVLSFDAINAEAVRWARLHAGALVVGPAGTREIVNVLVSASQMLGIPPREVARRLFGFMQAGVIGLDPRRSAAVAAFARRLSDEGIPTARLLQRVSRYADAQRRARAMLIARTETIAAVAQGQQALWTQAVREGLVDAKTMGKTWITTADDITCPRCENLDGVIVPIDDEFPGGVTAPPLHPACRCATGLAEIKDGD